MEMKLKLSEVLNLNQTLKIVIDDTYAKVDALFKFKLLGIMKAIEPIVLNFEIIRNEKINEYGEKNKEGLMVISQDNKEAVKKFNDDIKTVINSEVTINIEKLKVSDVFNKGVKAEYLMNLYTIIEE